VKICEGDREEDEGMRANSGMEYFQRRSERKGEAGGGGGKTQKQRAVTSSPRFRMGLPPEPRRLDGGSVAEVPAFAPGFTHIGSHLLVWGGSHRLSARRGISSPTATPFPRTHRFHPFGRPLSKGLSNVENGSLAFKFIAIHPRHLGRGLLLARPR